jgi:hypothetical protein
METTGWDYITDWARKHENAKKATVTFLHLFKKVVWPLY